MATRITKPKKSAPAPSPASAGKAPSITLWLGIAVAIVIADQITKIWVLKTMHYGQLIPVTSFFNLLLVYNEGAAFSFLANQAGWQRYFFAAISIGAIALIIYLMRRHPEEKTYCLSLALILGGAVGNLIDRSLYGYVIDFLDFYAGRSHWPTFNIADCGVTVGAVLFFWVELKRGRQKRDEALKK